MKIIYKLFISYFLLLRFHADCALNVEIRRQCCNIGTEHANSGQNCNSIKLDNSAIPKESELFCIQSSKICCRKQAQDNSCQLGVEDAKNTGNCDNLQDARYECCDACQLGINTGKASESCDDDIGLSQLSGQAYADCCKSVQKSSTTPTAVETTEKSTVLTTPVSSTSVLRNDVSSLPPIENVCDIGDVCAQICIPTSDSYRCECNAGYKLMADGVSCKPEKKSANGKKVDNCAVNNPCDHHCTDTGTAIKCSCKDGFELGKDKKSCIDIDECSLNIHECEASEVCVNDDGGYFCDDPNFLDETENNPLDQKCPPGYKYNFEKLVCDDIDECQFSIICPRPKRCINTVGSFKCEGEDEPKCPPGFHFKSSINSCADIDECVTGDNDCNKESQTCLNTKGNYTCVDNVSHHTCPPGFKKNATTNSCEDINECEENSDICGEHEVCINEPGGHSCEPSERKPFKPLPPPYVPDLPPKPTEKTTEKSSTSPPPFLACSVGYKYDSSSKTCKDINECRHKSSCDINQDCLNVPGSYICSCKRGFTKDHLTGACIDINECQLKIHDCTDAQRCDNTIGSYSCSRISGCGTGYTLNLANGLCEDDDECTLGTHSCYTLGSNYRCRNTLGSYRCEQVRVVTPPSTPLRPPPTPPLPTTPPPSPSPAFSPVPSVEKPSFSAYQPPPQPSLPPYPSAPQPSSPAYPPPFVPSNNYPLMTVKRCLPGYIMNSNGQCEDVDECQSNPCGPGEKCLNFNGRFQCISKLQCMIGYEPSGDVCVDIDECARNTHKCKPFQICKNGPGFYTCNCPPGHHIDPIRQECVDIDECKFYKACADNANCINTPGSYTCTCKNGFQGPDCKDIDECSENPQLCEHKCVNLWGSYRCACEPGFLLNYDNRTCTDIDECSKFSDKRLCIGICENVPGSYKCTCPPGYRLASDGRICKDINECQQNVCPNSSDVCLNTAGGYKCYPIVCPKNYFHDPQHKVRCQRPATYCDVRDTSCIEIPQQYTYNFITLVSKLTIRSDGIDIFQIKGPQWSIFTTEFSMEITKVVAPSHVEKVNKSWFRITTAELNKMYLSLVRAIEGPQEIEIKVVMKLYEKNVMTGQIVAYIIILVSEYPY